MLMSPEPSLYLNLPKHCPIRYIFMNSHLSVKRYGASKTPDRSDLSSKTEIWIGSSFTVKWSSFSFFFNFSVLVAIAGVNSLFMPFWQTPSLNKNMKNCTTHAHNKASSRDVVLFACFHTWTCRWVPKNSWSFKAETASLAAFSPSICWKVEIEDHVAVLRLILRWK